MSKPQQEATAKLVVDLSASCASLSQQIESLHSQLREKDEQIKELEKEMAYREELFDKSVSAENYNLKAQLTAKDAQLAKYKAALVDAKSNMQFTVQTIDEILPKIWPEYQGPCDGDCEGPCECDTPELANELYAHRYHCLGGVFSIDDALAEGDGIEHIMIEGFVWMREVGDRGPKVIRFFEKEIHTPVEYDDEFEFATLTIKRKPTPDKKDE